MALRLRGAMALALVASGLATAAAALFATRSTRRRSLALRWRAGSPAALTVMLVIVTNRDSDYGPAHQSQAGPGVVTNRDSDCQCDDSDRYCTLV